MDVLRQCRCSRRQHSVDGDNGAPSGEVDHFISIAYGKMRICKMSKVLLCQNYNKNKIKSNFSEFKQNCKWINFE